MIYPNEKLVLFCDGANLFATSRALGFDVDYSRLRNHFAQKANLIRSYYYTAVLETSPTEHNPLRKMIDWLDYNGWTMVTKNAKEFTNQATGIRKIKGNMDIEIATDMLDAAQYADHLILITGDGDFKYVVSAVQRKGVKVSIVSSIQTSPPMCADELRRQADEFLDLKDFQSEVQRKDRE